MNIQNVIGELLYIGFVVEKGRCYGVRWKLGYRKILRTHIKALYELQKCLQLTDEKLVNTMIEKFVTTCNENNEIGKFYHFADKQIGELHVGKNSKIVNQLMNELFLDLLSEIEKLYIQKKKVYDLLCALHNLPRVYLREDKVILCGAISEQDAIKYAFNNMSFDMKNKYQKLLSLD